MSDFRMPSLGADMAHGTLVEWRVRPGDAVRRGDVVAVVDTEKAAIEVEVWESGIVEEILVPEGVRVPVGTPLARLRPAGVPAEEAPTEEPPPSPVQPAVAPPPPVPIFRPPSAADAGRVRASPAARRLGAERGVDLSALAGTGMDGAVVRADVERAAEQRAAAEGPGGRAARRRRVSPVAARVAAEAGIDPRTVRGTGSGGAVTRRDVERAVADRERARRAEAPEEEPGAHDRGAAMRDAIAAAVAKSKREIPHYYLWTHAELRRALDWLKEENARRGMEDRLLPAAVFLKATALALREFPRLNGFWIDGSFHPGAGVHPGVAVFLRGGGLVAPAILDADAKTLDTLMQELGDLVRRARTGGLRGAEVTSATVTVTNLGDRGVEGVLGVINPPQVAIVGIGRIVDRPWAEDGMVGVRPVAALTLAADHRASDGHLGSLFLRRIVERLQEPEGL